MRSDNPELPILNTKGESLGLSIGRYDQPRPAGATHPIHALCLAPFTAVDFGPDGTITVCNHYNHWIARIEEHESFLDVWRGPEFQKLRDDMRNYVLDEHRCRHCARHIRSGMPAQTFATQQFDAMPIVNPNPDVPDYLIFRLSNNCNLACVMCDEFFSSVIRDKREELPPLRRFYGEKFFEDIRQILPRARFVEFYGGEPFLVPEHRRIFELIEETGSQCGIYVNTNGTSLNAQSKNWLETLNFRVMAVSMDASNAKLHSRTRIGIVHDVLHRNFRWLLELRERKGLSISINVTELRQNWFDLPQMFRFAASVDCSIHINTCVWPPYCSLYTLPTDQLRFVEEYLVREQDRLGSILDTGNNRESYSLLLRMIAEELDRRTPESILPAETGVCADRYGTRGLLASPIPGVAPFDSPDALMQEIDRILAANLSCGDRLLRDMLEDLKEVDNPDEWAEVRRWLEVLSHDLFFEYVPIDRDARDLRPSLSIPTAVERVRHRSSATEVDIACVDSNGLLTRDSSSSEVFLGIPMEPLWGRPLWVLERLVRERHGCIDQFREITTPAFTEKVATLERSQGRLVSITIPRWTIDRQIEGNIIIAAKSAVTEPTETLLSPFFLDLAGIEFNESLNEILVHRAEAFMRSVAPDNRVLTIRCDAEDRVKSISGEIAAGRVFDSVGAVGRSLRELFEQLDCGGSPTADEHYWRPQLYDRVIRSKQGQKPTRLLSLPSFDAHGAVNGTTTLLITPKAASGVLKRPRRREVSTLLDVYAQLVPQSAMGEMTPERAISLRRRRNPTANVCTILTDNNGQVVEGPDRTWFEIPIAEFIGQKWQELLKTVTATWGYGVVEADNVGEYVHRVQRYHSSNLERVLELLVFPRSQEGQAVGSTIIATTSTDPPRNEFCLRFENRDLLGDLPPDASLTLEAAIHRLFSDGGRPIVKLRVDANDIVTTVRALESGKPTFDFSKAVGCNVGTFHGILMGALGSKVEMISEWCALGFRDILLHFQKGSDPPALVRAIELPIWAQDGTVEAVDIVLGIAWSPPSTSRDGSNPA